MAPEPLLRWIGFLYRIGPTRLRIEVVARMRERHHPTLAEHDVEVELLRQLLVLPYREVPANRAQIAFSRGARKSSERGKVGSAMFGSDPLCNRAQRLLDAAVHRHLAALFGIADDQKDDRLL